jgi:hypothetical protein
VGFFPVSSGQSIFSDWTVQNLGKSVQHSSGVFAFFLLQSLTGSAFAAQLFLYLGLFFIGSIGIVFVFRQLNLIRNDYLIVPIAIAYSLNWNLFLTLQFLEIALAAAAPFLFLFAARSIFGIGKMHWNVLGMTLSLLLMTSFANVGGFGNALYLLIPVILAGAIAMRSRDSAVQLLKGLTTIAISIILTTLIALPFFFQGYYLLITGGFHTYVAVSSGGSLTDVTPLTRLYYMAALMPSSLSPFIMGSSPTFTDFFWPLSLAGVALAAISLLTKDRRRKALALAFMLTIATLISLIYLVNANAGMVNTLYDSVPLLFVLIEAQNYLYTITPMWFILAALGVAALGDYSNRSRFRRSSLLKVLAVLLGCLTLTSSVSAFDFQPVNFSGLYQGTVVSSGTFPAQPPQSITSLFDTIQQNRTTQGPFRVLWLPYPQWLAELFYASGTPDVLNLQSVGNSSVVNSVVAALSPLMNSSTTKFGLSIAPFGFKYIVVPTYFSDHDAIGFQTVDGSPVQIVGSPTSFEEFMSNQNDIVPIKQTSSYVLYQNMAVPNNSSGVMWLSDTNLFFQSDTSLAGSNPVQIRSMRPSYSPSEYQLSVDASHPSWLIFDQSYDSGWVARMTGGSQPLNHTLAMGWANAFFIPKAGNFTITLDYQPQTVYNYVWIFSGALTVSLLVTICLLTYVLPRRNHEEKSNLEPNNFGSNNLN